MSRPDLARLWRSLPEELVDKVFATMPVDSLVTCRLVCRDWNSKIKSPNFLRIYRDTPPRDDPWLMCSSYNCRDSCYAYSPSLGKWFNLSLGFLPAYMRFPLASIGGLIFLVAGLSNLSILAVCNPLSRTWKELPQMTYKRYNPLVGVYQEPGLGSHEYKIVVAGGTSECGGDYECSAEVYDSATDTWTVLGDIPRSYTVKITLWTSKSVFCKGTLYCLTSARPYNLMACHLETKVWIELKVPQPACLFSSFLFERNQRLFLVGGVGTDRISISCSKAAKVTTISSSRAPGISCTCSGVRTPGFWSVTCPPSRLPGTGFLRVRSLVTPTGSQSRDSSSIPGLIAASLFFLSFFELPFAFHVMQPGINQSRKIRILDLD